MALPPSPTLAPRAFVPDWPAPRGVCALCTTRQGGASVAPFDSFNLGDHVRDDPAAVLANRATLATLCAPARPVYLQQVHGNDVVSLDADSTDGTVADAALVVAPGTAATIMVADCLPVLLAHTQGCAVAAAHTGWRGLAGGVLERAVQALRDAAGHGEVIAWLGPAIGPTAFEVGDEVRAAFVSADPTAAAHFRPHATPGKWWADLPGLACQRLVTAGVTSIHGNDGSADWCTVSQPSRFFSHRRDAARLGSTGRFAACIWIE
ncbi:MAG: peptidoglycan editing factor PgeF [Hydrogenophaga sp.]|uniref:peptidoglycan editing factor PgeF n=1 Tax=Hydrogenophaga sp. TaxID=1904254 RepID=UPI001D32C06C|nr:peptidoglycan editing factor PgeF [Hydrogenophaga sp.]MBX3610186.1 peptidoglycan editing factor PgeF [Hydrogenophaga sp.]